VKKINCIVLQEAIQNGQQVIAGKIELLNGSQPVRDISFTTIGHKRILTFPATEASAFNLVITDAKDTPQISEIGAYLIDEKLVEKECCVFGNAKNTQGTAMNAKHWGLGVPYTEFGNAKAAGDGGGRQVLCVRLLLCVHFFRLRTLCYSDAVVSHLNHSRNISSTGTFLS
jgi:hypothetical protein